MVASSALPTGASTAAKQPALGTAGTASADVITVQGIASMTPIAVSAASLPIPTGAATEAKQDTQITAEQAIQVSVEILDDWDESDRAKVNPIVGQAGVQGGSGTVSANTQRVVLATDVPLPATPAQILQEVGTQLRFCVSASYSPADPGTDFTIGSPTNVTLTLSGVASAAGRQSDKCDLGANRAASYEILAAVDYTGETPSATGRTDLYWAPSTSTTQGTGNIAGNSGADGAAPDGALGSITLAEFLLQCIYIGSLFTHDGGVVQNGFVGVFRPTGRYGQMIVVNNGGAAYEADNVEAAIFMNPIIDERQ